MNGKHTFYVVTVGMCVFVRKYEMGGWGLRGGGEVVDISPRNKKKCATPLIYLVFHHLNPYIPISYCIFCLDKCKGYVLVCVSNMFGGFANSFFFL